MENMLTGVKEICAYIGKSRNTFLRLVKEEGFPASKLLGVWASDKRKIEAWIAKRYL